MADFKISANVEVRKQAPWDDRIAKPTKADLINPDSWASDNGTYYVYKYMVVGTADGLFMLTDVDKLLNTDYSGWLKIGESSGDSSGTGDGLSEQEVQALIDAAIEQVEGKIPTDYLTEVPSEYITETELEERLANFGGEGGGSLTEGISQAQAQALVNVEKIRAEKIEASLQAQIDTEVTRAKTVEQQLTERITQETANSDAAYDQINTRIDNEISRATEAEQTIEGKIPTKVSQLQNDSNFLTSHQDISHLATKTELSGKQDIIPDLQEIREGSQRHIPSKVSELENDSGYFTQNDCDARYLLKQVFSNIFTAYDVNGEVVDITNVESVIDNVGINYNLWSTGYISSLGKQQDDSFGGSAMALYQLVDVEEYDGKVMGAQNGSVLMYDGTHWNAKTNIIADLAAAKSDSNQALIQSGEAKVTADAAKTQADIAIQSIKSLQGLSDADQAMVEIANQIVQIQQNTSDVAILKQQHVAMSLDEFEQIELEGQLKEGVFYYIYEG